MKILYIIPELSTGGSERQLLLLAGELQGLGHTVRILTLRPSRRPLPVDERLDIRALRGPAPWDPRWLWAFGREYRTFSPDVVHTVLFGFDLWANLAARFLHVPCVISSRRQLAAWRRKRHLYWQGLANRFVDAVITNSQAAAEYGFATERHLNRGRIYSIPNLCAPPSVAEPGATTPLPTKTRAVFTYVANFWPGKRHDLLIDAFAACHADLDADLWLVGEGDGLAATRERITAHGLESRVHLLGRRHDIPVVLANSDLYLHVSDHESSPNAVLEAMAAGLPVIAAAAGGVPELLAGGHLGTLVIPNSQDALVAAMRYVRGAGCADAARKAETARASLARHHAPAVVAARHVEVYHRYLASTAMRLLRPRRVGVFLLGDRDLPSAWFRILQLVPCLQAGGFDLDIFEIPAGRGGRWRQFSACFLQGVTRYIQLRRAHHYDRLIIQKGLTPARFSTCLQRFLATGRPFVYDIDDRVHQATPVRLPRGFRWLQNTAEPEALMKAATHVMAGNACLAAAARDHNDTVTLIPTVVDTNRYWYSPVPHDGPAVIGWSGSRGTNPYLNMLAPALRRLAETQGFILRVMSQDLQGIDLDAFRGVALDFRPWRRDDEVAILRTFTIGVMPLPDNDWERGKCGLKALTYMALGIPAVCSPVGVNREIIDDGVNGLLAAGDEAWYECLSRLLNNPEERSRMGACARRTVEDGYALAVAGEAVCGVLRAGRDAEASVPKRETL